MKLSIAFVMTLAVFGLMMNFMGNMGTAHDENKLQTMDSHIDRLDNICTGYGYYIQSQAYKDQQALELNQFIYWAAWNGHY